MSHNIIGNMNGVSKFDLRLGNIFEQGIVCKINGRTGAKVHVYGKLKWKKGLKVIESVAVEDLKPIPLSPQVLVDWCGFVEKNDFASTWWEFGIGFQVGNGGDHYYVDFGTHEVTIRFLHELQNLYYVICGKELEIKE